MAYKILRKKITPKGLFRPRASEPFSFLFESSKRGAMGRFSFFSSSPFAVISTSGGKTFYGKPSEPARVSLPFTRVLREALLEYGLSGTLPHYPFLCGAAGFLGYELGASWEGIRRRHAHTFAPDGLFGLYDSSVIVDHLRGEAMIFSSGFPEHGKSGKKRAKRRMEEVLEQLNSAPGEGPSGPEAFEFSDGPSSNFTRRQYLAAVRKAKSYIAAGDIYQVNLSQRFAARLKADDWQLYRKLSSIFPVCFSGFFRGNGYSLISASPERFLDLKGGIVSTRPMKGTRPRSGISWQDGRRRKELLKSVKERAELLMVVDLERNDLGRVCSYGTIRLRRKRDIECYKSVFQATSEVEGRLHPSKDRVDLLRACFPGGSITGCPKIRAMQIIEELENVPRGIYTGSMGYLGFRGDMQFNVLIRTIFKAGDLVHFHLGGGIVADSDPEKEYEETLIKGRALFEAVTGSQQLKTVVSR